MAPPLLTARNMLLSFGGRPLFMDLNFSIEKGHRISLVGRNGSGKSTLLKVLSKRIDADDGTLFMQPGLTLSYLAQDHHLSPELTPLEYCLRDHIDHFVASKYLDLLSVPAQRMMTHLSGGERRRIALAHALAKEADILCLDEPTNHLDMPTIEWLESYCTQFKGALMVISHDRSFLNKVSNRTFWIDRGNLFAHDKGYADFERWSELLMEEEARHIEKMDVKLRQEQEWLHRGVTARRKRNQGRLRQLHALRASRKDLEKNKQRSMSLVSGEGDMSSKLIMEAQHISKAYGEKKLIHDFSTRLLRGDRIGVIGPNGAGKTTLLRILVGQENPDEGCVRTGTSLELVYFDQMRDTINPHETLWQNLCPTGGDQICIGGQYRHVVGYLRDFLFDEKQIRGLAGILSGGEKNRLALAKALTLPSNVLVLDEPTNDLDMETLDLLIEMLSDYTGTIMVVSHDRDFLNKTVTSIIAVEGEGVVEEYVGGYDDYLVQRKPLKKVAIADKSTATSQVTRDSSQPSKRLSYHQQRLLELLPGQINTLEEEINSIETRLADPSFYTHHTQEFRALSETLESLKKDLNAKEDVWLELCVVGET